MKKILFLLLGVVLIFGCKPSEIVLIPAYENLLGYDFRPFAKRGFLITPYSYDGKYTAIAIINFKIMPESNLVLIKSGYNYNTNTPTTVKNWVSDTVETDEALERIYQHCIEIGADALVDFKITDVTDYYTKTTPNTTIEGKRITGFAIRRED